MIRRYTRRLLLACAAAMVMPGLAVAQQNPISAPLRKVSFAISTSAVTIGHAHLAAIPLAMGYFKEEGLDVSILNFPGAEVLNHVVAGDIVASDGGTPASIAAIGAGQKLVTVFASVTGNPYYVVAPEKSSIHSLKDLVGKNVGVYDLAAAGFTMLRGQLIQEGIDPAKINFIPIPSPAEAANALKLGRIDTYHGFDIFYSQLESLGIPLRRVPTQADKVGALVGMTVRRDMLQKDRELYVKLARAFVKGVVFAHANPEAAVRLTWKLFPGTKGIGMSEDAALAAGLRVTSTRYPNIDKVDGLYGNATEEQLVTLLDLLTKGGVLQKPLKPADVWSNTLIADANKVDFAAIEQQAKSWKPD